MNSSVISKNSLIALILLAVLVAANILIFFLPTMQTSAEKDLESVFPELNDVNVSYKLAYLDGENNLTAYIPEMALSMSTPTIGASLLYSVLAGRFEAAYSSLSFTSFNSYEEVDITLYSLYNLLSSDYKFTYFFGNYSYEDYVNKNGIYKSFGLDCLSYFYFYEKGGLACYALTLSPNFDADKNLTYTFTVRAIFTPWDNPTKINLLVVDNIPSGNLDYGDVGFITLDLSALFSPSSTWHWRLMDDSSLDRIIFRISPRLDMSGVTSKLPYNNAQSFSMTHMSIIDDAIISNHLEYLDFTLADLSRARDDYYKIGYNRGYDEGIVEGSKLESGIVGFFPSVFQGFGSFIKTVLDFEVFGISVLKVVGVIGLLILLFMFIRLLR